jgi:hypothetical protein
MATCEGCNKHVKSEMMLSVVNYLGQQKKFCSLCRERAGQMGQLTVHQNEPIRRIKKKR